MGITNDKHNKPIMEEGELDFSVALDEGPWTADFLKYPDNEYLFEYHGYSCLARRNPMKAWCGYITLPKSHPDFENSDDYDSIDDIYVHGGFTFSDSNGTFGFDCCHFGDIVPNLFALHKLMNLKVKSPDFPQQYKYWTLDDIKDELESVAKQFKDRDNIDDVSEDIDNGPNEDRNNNDENIDDVSEDIDNSPNDDSDKVGEPITTVEI